ncbi:MAG TPA: DNA polymerase III subunit delta' [Chloroflexota bacterium]|nr:DNA polymerase III subunit delta' [Chloroflexota bacterium]
MAIDTAGAWGIAGHEWAVALLDRSLAHGTLAHAYLFSGPPRIGKYTLARAFAQALNCLRPPRCGQCRPCSLIARDLHPDVRTLVRPSDKKNLGIDEIKELREDVALKPLEARHKVYILREAEDLSEPAANALLKTLEEPPANVVLILTAADASLLLPTVVSRCQHLRLRPLAWATVVAQLQAAAGLDAAQAERLADLAAGHIGWALRAAADPAVLAAHDQHLVQLGAALGGSTLDRLRLGATLAETWSSHPDAVRETLATWRDWWRARLLAALGAAAPAEGPAFGGDAKMCRAALERVQQALADLDANVHPRLALEALLLVLPRA